MNPASIATSPRFRRYAGAIAGPVGAAIAQFSLSLVLLRSLPTEAFGSFTLLLVLSQLALGLWGALFCAPMPALVSQVDTDSGSLSMRTLLASNLLGAVIVGIACVGAAFAPMTPTGAILFGTYVAISLLRWFARARSYTQGAQARTIASDAIYSGTLLAGVISMLFSGEASTELAFATLLVSATLGLLPFGSNWAHAQFIAWRPSHLPPYRNIWRRHGRWAMLGVVTTEATSNAHVYIVTYLSGTSAFAPLAASALLIRPINVVMNALTEFERPQLARHLSARREDQINSTLTLFRMILIATWIATAALAAALLWNNPRLIFPAPYELSMLETGVILWMAVAAIRLLRTPESVLLQAAGSFRRLAFASVLSSICTVIAVTLTLLAYGPLWSITGVALGELIMACWIWREARPTRRRARVSLKNL